MDKSNAVLYSPTHPTPQINGSSLDFNPTPTFKSSPQQQRTEVTYSPKAFAEPYSIPVAPISLEKEVDIAPAVSIDPAYENQYHKRTIWHRMLYPTGVKPRDRKAEHWVGRIGFAAKGVLYGMVGGMTCASAIRLNELNGSPQGAFVLIGTFPGGEGALVFMLLALLCYVAWRWWEFATFQGADATFSPGKNFFAYRLSPLVSGCVYVAYGFYIGEVLAKKNKNGVCYPSCWRSTVIGRVGLVLFGVAFAIACITQLLNAFTRKWHSEINWEKTNIVTRRILQVLGHLGFLGRAGLFLFVAILMFRALRGSAVANGGNTIANGLNQFIGTGAGRVFMFIVGFLTLLYGCFAILCVYFRHFPTPPPSGIPLYYNRKDQDPRLANATQMGPMPTIQDHTLVVDNQPARQEWA